MQPIHPALKALARRILAFEIGNGGPAPGRTLDALQWACRKLHQRLHDLIGEAYDATLASALEEVAREVPVLGALRVEPHRCFALADAERWAAADAEDLAQGAMLLLARILDLLTLSLGQPLMARILAEAWPDLALH